MNLPLINTGLQPCETRPTQTRAVLTASALLLAFLTVAQLLTAAEIKVELQPRRTWDFKSAGVRFDNQFSGARLNDVEQTGEHDFTVTIDPENRPINTSPWYAFQ